MQKFVKWLPVLGWVVVSVPGIVCLIRLWSLRYFAIAILSSFLTGLTAYMVARKDIKIIVRNDTVCDERMENTWSRRILLFGCAISPAYVELTKGATLLEYFSLGFLAYALAAIVFVTFVYHHPPTHDLRSKYQKRIN